ncbi:ZGRF1 protein, partial [Rhinoptilus africanus]|nr:ZGRF1 protein [Rhinoptilus africanus]
VLYTHQKMKKSKTWQDGILRVRTGGNKAVLFDDKGQCLESIFIKSQVNAGDNLESERYLITVEAVKVNENSVEGQPRNAGTPAVDRKGVKPSVTTPRHHSVGLKRKFTGFQGPRQVEKKISAMEDGENPTMLPLPKQCQGTFPSKFYITSPLFSTICKKDAETNLPAGLDEDLRVDNDRERMSLSSLLSAPFLDGCEEREKQNTDGLIVKPETPLITGHAVSCCQTVGRGAVSHNIRSTAQIIALLKSKPMQGCREQTPEVTECLSRFWASENADSSCNQNSTILPAFSGNPAERLMQNIKHLPSMKGTVNDKKECNAEMLLNSAEQLCDKEVSRQTHVKRADNVSGDLQDPCNANSFFLPESTLSRMSGSQFVPSSGDILWSANPITTEKNLFRYKERSVTNGFKENSSVKLPSELEPRPSSEGVPGDLELSVGATLPEVAMGEDVTQNAALGLHSCSEVVTHGNNQVKLSAFDGEKEGYRCTEGIPSQLCHTYVGDTERMAGDSSNQTRTEVELLGDRHNVKAINASQLGVEATNYKKDLYGCAAHAVKDMSRVKSKHSDPLPGDTNVNEGHPKTSMSEKTESISFISTEMTEGDVIQLGCVKSPGADLEHLWGTRRDDIKPGSPLLALSQKSDPSHVSFHYIVEDHEKVFGISPKEDTLASRSSAYPLGKDNSSPVETATGETEFEDGETTNAFREACQGARTGMDCLKGMARAESSSSLPDLVNNIALLRALTQHSTALESLQKMEENNSVLHE